MKERKEYVIQCKVSDSVHRRLEAVREKYGFRSIYEVMQSLLTLFVRYISTPIETGGTEVDELQELFGDFGKRGKRMNITGAGHEQGMKMMACVGVMKKPDTPGRILKTYTATAGEKMCSDYSTDTAVRTIIKAVDKELYERINDIGVMIDEKRMLHVLEALVDEYENSICVRAIQEEFGDDDNIPSGEALMREH
jgi:hypothetical protein